ncbi:MAG TPA: DNA mismatch repair endonuclease MutL [Candidatus Hydrothermia bacterium]|nr:DNA mismatch repair endonuclease MutL [Candidatus Hydrothermia bacterium]
MIKRLSDDVIKKISAGEVIENPASCVRELIENSLDAGADSIVIRITGGGIDSIEVVDNGCGLSKEEITLAVQHFTTSKITSFDDLKNLNTLGFRGEALYAISQVSQLTIKSCQDESIENGWECEFEAGKLKDCKPTPHKKGTSVIVRDLFFNVPVRRKFLMSKREEGKYVFSEVISYALWHNGVEFVLYDDERKKLDLPKGDFASTVMAIYGRDFIERLLFFSYGDDYVEVTGFCEKPDRLSNKIAEQIVLINGRKVKKDQIRKVFYRAYDHPRQHPSFIIRIQVKPEFVDFNIHPQKREVKIAPYVRLNEKIFRVVSERIAKYQHDLGSSIENVFQVPLKLVNDKTTSQITKQLEFGEISDLSAYKTLDREEEKHPVPGIWQAHNSYILVQTASGVMIIDQHAAHERVIYDKLKKKKFSNQGLMFPVLLELSSRERELFTEYSEIFSSFGFEFRFLSESSLVVDKVPSILKRVSREELKDLIDSLEDSSGLPNQLDTFLKTVACKAAVKFGDPLSKEEMAELVDELFTTEAPFHCPHGRPTIYFISLEELASKFAR